MNGERRSMQCEVLPQQVTTPPKPTHQITAFQKCRNDNPHLLVCIKHACPERGPGITRGSCTNHQPPPPFPSLLMQTTQHHHQTVRPFCTPSAHDASHAKVTAKEKRSKAARIPQSPVRAPAQFGSTCVAQAQRKRGRARSIAQGLAVQSRIEKKVS